MTNLMKLFAPLTVPRSRIISLILLGVLGLFLLPQSPAYAASITVTTTADTIDAAANCPSVTLASLPGPDGQTSLREAVCAANSNAGADTITFSVNGTFTLNRTGQNDDAGNTGDLDITGSLTLQGNGTANTIIDGNNTDAVLDTFTAPSAMTLNFNNLTIQRGNPTNASFESGGAIYIKSIVTVNLSGVVVQNNIADSNGGAIYNEGTLIISNSTLSGNQANAFGGAIYTIGVSSSSSSISNSTLSGNRAEYGGAIYTSSNAGINLTITGSTISGNFAEDRPGGPAGDFGDGAGIYATTDATIAIANSTISGNSAARSGGGVFLLDSNTSGVGTMTLNNVTVSNNTANSDNDPSGDGGGVFVSSGTANVTNTIIAGNTDNGGTNNYPDAAGTFSNGGNNLIGKNNGSNFVAGALVGTIASPVNPLLGSLANNTGSTLTHALLAGSPALNAGNNATCAATDQRGIARPVGGVCDIGSFELADLTPPDTTITANPPNPSNSSTAPFLFTGSDSGGSGLAGFQCQLDGGGFSSCTSPRTYLGLGDGSHTFQVRAIDGAGNIDPTPASYTWIINTDPAQTGATLVVNVTNDNNSTCTQADCSLREAIILANSTPSTNETITFNIPGSGTRTINLTSALPQITNPVTIDGTTQAGAGSDCTDITAPLIELNGSALSVGDDGLWITAGNSVARGLTINRFPENGLQIETNGGNRVECSYIGLDATGTLDLGNGRGIYSDTPNNTIGGAATSLRNVISGNNGDGITLDNAPASDNLIQNNYIGTNAAGTGAIGNSATAITTEGDGTQILNNVVSGNGGSAIQLLSDNNTIQGNRVGTNAAGTAAVANLRAINLNGTSSASATNNQIGGTTAAQRNIFSGNSQQGVLIQGALATGNRVEGNYIGVAADGSTALANGTHGVWILSGASTNTIGGTTAGAGNVIRSNGGDGVFIDSGTGNSIRANSITGNTGLGVDLGPDGVTANDSGDGDIGTNNLQNFPVLSNATPTGVLGTLNSAANTSFTIEFYANAACDASNNGEGQTYLGSTTTTTNAGGNGIFSFAASLSNGQIISALATRNTAPLDTSEFSQCITVTAASTTFEVNSQDDDADSSTADGFCFTGQLNTAGVPECTLRAAIQQANTTAGANTINFNIPGSGTHTFTPATLLPDITGSVFIDGLSQPANGGSAASCTAGPLLIEIRTANGTVGSGLRLSGAGSSGSTIRGLAISGFNGDGASAGVFVTASSNNIIQCNFLGTNAAGTAQANGGNNRGVLMTSSTNNRVGTNGDGTNDANERNVISGNATGVIIDSGSTANVVAGNYIGSDVTGSTGLTFGSAGIRLAGNVNITNNIIGFDGTGTASVEGNLIRSQNNGISHSGGTGNRFSANRIYGNSTIGIDLVATGPGTVTPNDAGDPDTGANNLQNFPVLSSVTSAGVVDGSLDSLAANTAYPVRLEFFANTTCDTNGYGEGEVYLGAISLAAPGSFNTTLSLVAGRNFVTATAIDNNGNTSEFSTCRQIGDPDLTLTKRHTGNFTQGQTGAQYTIVVTNTGTALTNGTVTVVDTLPAGLTATALSGTGWSCTLATLTCTRSDALAAGSSYPDITLTVNVAGSAPASVTNTVAVSGGGEQNTTNNTASDPTTINQIPVVTNVTSSAPNGIYGTGVVIPVTVTFSEAVLVTGTPQLTLETGATNRVVNYSSGSGTSTLTFAYTVQAGDTSADLDYLAANALALNSGAISSAALVNAVLTLPTPGNAGSLGANKDIVIDAIAPTVTSVTSSVTNGFYRAGAVIPVTVTFNKAVLVTGTPQLTLETGAPDRVVNYSSGSGSNTLTFAYTVQAGDTSADLDYLATNSLVLNGGTIRDAASNNAVLTLPTPGAAGSLGANKDIVIDTTNPTVTYFHRRNPLTSPTNADTLQFEVDFSEPIGAPGLIGTNDFVVSGTPGTTATPTSISVVDFNNGAYAVDVTGGDLANYNGTVGLDFSTVMSITDRAGNPLANVEPLDDEIYLLDNAGPAVTIDQAAPQNDPTNSSPINFTVVFSKPVTGFATGDVTLAGTAGATNATVTEIAPNDGTTYSVAVSSMTGDGTVIASIAAGTAQDALGNSNVASTSTDNTVTYDTTPPPAPVVITPANGSRTNNTTPTVTGTAEPDSTVSVYIDGVLAGTTSADASGSWAFTPGSALSENTHTVRARATDAAGNTSVDSNTNTFTVDTTGPTVAMASTAPDPTATSPIPVTVTFSEDVTGFTAGDIVPGNATINNFSGSGSSYTFDLIPAGFGLVTADIAAGVAQDEAGNDNTAATQFSRIFAGPEIALLGNNIVIPSGDTSPSLADLTDFGSIALGGTITRTFTISNSGGINLILNGSPLVALSGPAAGDFSVVANPVTPVISQTSTTFQVSFTPSVSGTHVATVTLANNDSDENPYTFVISGVGIDNSGGSSNLTLYLPLLLKDFVTGPDLVVTSLTATSSGVTVVIKNQGDTPVVDAFWVDVYFNPSSTPAVNKRWQDIAPAGAVWGVRGAALPLDPGESITLTSGDAYYFPQLSSSPPLPVGANVFALADSTNFSTTYGAVKEVNEANNLSGSVISTASSAQPLISQAGEPSSEGLPPR